jgi:hypothetical protein
MGADPKLQRNNGNNGNNGNNEPNYERELHENQMGLDENRLILAALPGQIEDAIANGRIT